tara:strand:+ start:1078 stop:1272 length:195 start_codon:yes stop_codon:yes gene_type:complete
MKTTVIDGTEYDLEQLTPEQRLLANHIADLDRKLGSAKFNVDQMTVGRNAFAQLFERSLASERQ